MAIQIVVPRLGWSMEDGTFGQWLKADGETVNEGDPIYELESDKATQEVESFETGILRLLPNSPVPGEIVKVGQVLGYLCADGEEVPIDQDAESCDSGEEYDLPSRIAPLVSEVGTPAERRILDEIKQVNQPTNGELFNLPVNLSSPTGDVGLMTRTNLSPEARPSERSIRVSPRAARIALERGIDLRTVKGTGHLGRIRECDVRSIKSEQQIAAPTLPSAVKKDSDRIIKTGMRQIIAARMLEAVQQTAQVTLSSQADATKLVSIRQQLQGTPSDEGSSVPSFTDFFIKISSVALERHPTVMHQWTDSGLHIPPHTHVALAVNTEHGLYAPVVRNASSLSLIQITELTRNLVTRARKRQLGQEDLSDGVFTVSNLGGYRVDAFTPIITLPQTAILGIGRIAPAPVVVNNSIAIRNMVTLSLTFDHRVIDGAPAAAFLTTICELVERPAQWLIP